MEEHVTIVHGASTPTRSPYVPGTSSEDPEWVFRPIKSQSSKRSRLAKVVMASSLPLEQSSGPTKDAGRPSLPHTIFVTESPNRKTGPGGMILRCIRTILMEEWSVDALDAVLSGSDRARRFTTSDGPAFLDILVIFILLFLVALKLLLRNVFI
jgi:hypothetical protein